MNCALSQLDVGVAAGGIRVGGIVGKGMAVGGMDCVDVAAGDAAGTVAGSCACTVSAAAVMIAPGSCWFGLLEGRLQARMARMMARPARM